MPGLPCPPVVERAKGKGWARKDEGWNQQATKRLSGGATKGEHETAKSRKVKTSKRWLVRIVVVGGAAYVGVCVVVGFLQGRLIYFPSRGYAATPGDVGLKFEDLRLRMSDGATKGEGKRMKEEG